MKKIIIAMALALGLKAEAVNWTNYPSLLVPLTNDTFLLATPSTTTFGWPSNYQMTALAVLNWTKTNALQSIHLTNDFALLTINQLYTNKVSPQMLLIVDELLTADATHAASLGFFVDTNGGNTWNLFRTNSNPVVVAGGQTKSFTALIATNWSYVVTNLDAAGIAVPSKVTFTHRHYQN